MLSKGTLDALIPLRGLAYDMLSGYDNVTLYDFATREDWVLSLANYKDTLHYGEWINDEIVREIAAGHGAVLSRSDLDQASARLRAWANDLIAAGEWIYD